MADLKNGRYQFGWGHRDDEMAQNGVTHKHFSTPQRLAEWMLTDPGVKQSVTKRAPTADQKQYGISAHDSYYDYNYDRKLAKGLTLLQEPDSEMVSQVRDIMKQLQAQLPTTQRNWASAPVGFFPNVPAYLAGEPENMFTYQRANSDTSPVRIWVNVLPSGGCDRTTLMKRGAVLVALANLLLERRSMVRITCYGDQPAHSKKSYTGTIISWDLPTSPLSLSTLCTSLGYPEVVQNVTFKACHTIDKGVTGGWLRGHCPGYSYNEKQVRADLGADDEDVIIPAAFLGDQLHNKPVDFLHRELTRILGDSDTY